MRRFKDRGLRVGSHPALRRSKGGAGRLTGSKRRSHAGSRRVRGSEARAVRSVREPQKEDPAGQRPEHPAHGKGGHPASRHDVASGARRHVEEGRRRVGGTTLDVIRRSRLRRRGHEAALSLPVSRPRMGRSRTFVPNAGSRRRRKAFTGAVCGTFDPLPITQDTRSSTSRRLNLRRAFGPVPSRRAPSCAACS